MKTLFLVFINILFGNAETGKIAIMPQHTKVLIAEIVAVGIAKQVTDSTFTIEVDQLVSNSSCFALPKNKKIVVTHNSKAIDYTKESGHRSHYAFNGKPSTEQRTIFLLAYDSASQTAHIIDRGFGIDVYKAANTTDDSCYVNGINGTNFYKLSVVVEAIKILKSSYSIQGNNRYGAIPAIVNAEKLKKNKLKNPAARDWIEYIEHINSYYKN